MKKMLKCILVLAGAGLLCIAGLIGFVFIKEHTIPAVGEYDAIIVLGAQVLPDGTPSVALSRRINAALDAYRSRPSLIICCGAKGENEPRAEGEVMRDLCLGAEVSEESVIAESASFNTRQNLLNAKAIMQEKGLSEALVVTSDYHVPRALALCRDIGIRATGKGSPSKPEYFLKNHIREGLSWVKYLIESVKL